MNGFECGMDVELEMERLKNEFESGGKPEEHKDMDRIDYINKQIYLMRLLLTTYKKSYSFRDKMRLRAGIAILEIQKKELIKQV